MDDFIIALQAGIDEAKSAESINKNDIPKLQKKLDALKLQATIDKKSLEEIASQLEKITGKKISFSNIGIDTKQANKDGKKYGEAFNKGASEAINSDTAEQINKISDASTATIVSNEKRKRQAIQDTARVQEQSVKNGNIIQQTDFALSFDTKGEAEKYFNVLSKAVSVQEKLGENKNLESFIIEVKNAEGVVEKLTYKYNELTGAFEYSGGSINDNGVIKQMNMISAKADNLQTKLDKLKVNYSDINSARPIKDFNNISALSEQYNKVSQAIEYVRNADNNTFSSMVSNAQREITVLESMVTQFRNAENVATQMKSVDISSGIAQARERLGKLTANASGFEQMTQTIHELDVAIENVGDKSSLDKFLNDLRVAETRLGRVKAETKQLSHINKIQLSIDDGTYESKVESLIAKTNQWTDANGNARISTNELSSAFNQLTIASNNYANSPTEAHQRALIASEKEFDKQIRTVTNSVRSMNAELAKDSKVSSLHNQLADFMSKNGKTVRYFGNDLREIFNQTAQGSKLTNQELAVLKQRFIDVQNVARNTGKLGKTFFQTIREGMSSFSYWTSSTFLIMKAIQSVKGGIRSVMELDTALVDLRKTTTMTYSELEKFYYEANTVAKQMGVTTAEIINQASAWSRLGYSSAEAASKMAKYSSMFASISPGMNVDTATDGLVSVMKAFDIGNDNPDDVLDGIMSKINVIGNTAATSNAEIVNMLTRSSSAMKEANNTLEETIALETAAVEITRDDASVGTAFKTVAMRIRGYDEETEEFIGNVEELSGEIANLTKTASTPGGISLFTDNTKTEYKSTYQLLKEISEIYDQLSDKDQAGLLEALAGKRQGQIIAATINNFKAAEKAMNNMANSAGSAEAEMSVIMDSVEYKVNRLKETTTGIAQNLFKKDDMKTVLDGLTSIMALFDKLTSKLGLLGTIGLGSGIFAGFKNVGGRKNVSPICYLF